MSRLVLLATLCGLLLSACSSDSSDDNAWVDYDAGGNVPWGQRDVVGEPLDDATQAPEDAGDEPGVDVPTQSQDTGDPVDPVDRDRDGVPDDHDRWADDPDMPGPVESDTVYAHTDNRLYRMDVKAYGVEEIGPFVWPVDGQSHEMTDLAIDQWGVIYGVSFDAVYTCHAQTAACTFLGALPDEHWFNGLTFVPGVQYGASDDVLVGISQGGRWFKLDTTQTPVGAEVVGEYLGFTSSGDAYSVLGLGTFAAVSPSEGGTPRIVRVIAQTATVQPEGQIAIDQCSSVWGLAGWNEKAFAFCSDGVIIIVDVDTGAVLQVNHLYEGELSWWGAGTVTRF